jgi:mRNA interferase MazF
LKVELNSIEKQIHFHEREIWYLSIWENIWFEQNWKWENFLRPVLVYKKFNNNSFYWIPLTSKMKNSKFYYSFEFKKNITSSAILSQMRLFDKKRLYRRYWMISLKFYEELTIKIKKLLF